MLARVHSAAVLGVDAYRVDVEIDIANGLPSFATVGLPQGAVKESRERVTAALQNSGFDFPLRRVTANLAPADGLPLHPETVTATRRVTRRRPVVSPSRARCTR